MLKNRLRYFILPLVLVIIVIIIILFKGNDSVSDQYEQIDIPQVDVTTEVEAVKLALQENSDSSEFDKITDFNVSPNGNKLVVLVSTGDSTNGFDLHLADSNGTLLKMVAKDVIRARFIDNDNFYYQRLTDNPGVYKYKISTGDEKRIIDTKDANTFQNVLPVSNDIYFFNQPSTGKIGFIDINKTQTSTLAQEQLKIDSNYVKKSAFSYASISPNKEFISVYNLNPDDEGVVQLYVVPVSAQTESDILKFSARFRAGVIETFMQNLWSADSNYVALGTDGTILDVNTGQIVKNGTEEVDRAIVFGPKEKYIEIQTDTQTVKLKSLSDNTDKLIENQVPTINWLDSDNLVFAIGNRLFIYNIPADQLLAVNKNEAAFRIVQSSSPSLWILENSQIVKLEGQ